MRDGYCFELGTIWSLLLLGIGFDCVSFILATGVFYGCWGIASIAQSLSEIKKIMEKKR